MHPDWNCLLPRPACGGGTDEMQLVGGPVRVPKTDFMTPLNSRK
jgi:hypothetical protein